MENYNLIWDEENQYWFCSCCGAIYRQPKNWKPKASYCMRCRNEWDNWKVGDRNE